jgi:hypothetical protein
VQLHVFITSVLHGRESSASLDRGQGGSQSRSVRSGEGKKSNHCPCRESNPARLACSSVTVLTELPQYEHFR